MALKRKNTLARKRRKVRDRRYDSPKAIDNSNSIMFWAAAEDQGCCAVCKVEGVLDRAPRDWQAHHVVERQYLRANFLPQFDQRNSLRVCNEPCHGQHTRRFKKIPLVALTDQNLEYAFEVLGSYAPYYLRQRYAGDDPRLDRMAMAA